VLARRAREEEQPRDREVERDLDGEDHAPSEASGAEREIRRHPERAEQQAQPERGGADVRDSATPGSSFYRGSPGTCCSR
jgi:hypothetical protein